MKIGYLCFGKDILSYGLAYCVYRAGLKAERATPSTLHCFDRILVSLFWWKHTIEFIMFCEKYRVGKKYSSKPLFIVGGFEMFNPVVLKKYAHVCVVGDGEDVILDALRDIPNACIYTGNELSVNYNQADITANDFIFTNSANISRIEIARGCKYKCKYCQLKSLKKYREVGIDAIGRALSFATSRRVVLFAPNRTSHSKNEEIIKLLVKYKKNDICPDVRFNEVNKYYGTNRMQIGIEGISEKLRFAVGKNLTDERLIDICTEEVARKKAENNLACLGLGYILDLPGTTEDDYREFSNFLDELSAVDDADRLTIFFVFSMFQPMPFTEMEDDVIDIEQDHWLETKKCLYNRRFKICVKGRTHSVYSRLCSMMVCRGDEDTPEEIIRIVNSKETKLKSNILTRADIILKNRGGINYYLGRPIKKPWKIVNINF